MPRISNIYSIPPGTEGFPDTTIESEKYNNYIHDVETDLNAPRPISAGGTGANNADAAIANLGGEKSSQAVSNYDTHLFYPGSFYSAPGATAAPVSGHAFVGTVVSSDPPATPPTNLNVVVEARDQNDTTVPGKIYVREKKAGVWGAWTVIDASTLPFPPGGGITGDTILEAIQELDADKVNRAGDTITGDLTVEGDLTVDGTLTAEGPFTAQGPVTLPATPPVNATDAASKGYVDTAVNTKVNRAGDTMTGALTVNSNISATGAITAGSGITLNGDAGFQSSSTGIYVGSNGGGFAYRPYGVSNPLNAFQMYPSGIMMLNGWGSMYDTAAGVNAGHGCKMGTNNVTNGNYFNIWYESSNGLNYLCINQTSYGSINLSSDYRIKKDVTPLPAMWDTVKALKPISYTHQDFTPASALERSNKIGEPLIKADNVKRWGFIAHEVQEATVATASSAPKDAPDAIQDLNLAPVVAALTKALQEAMARIEALEAAV